MPGIAPVRPTPLNASLRHGALVFALALAFDAMACDKPAGRLVAVEGRVEVRAAQTSAWIAGAANRSLCPGDQVAVRDSGRAAVVLSNDVLVRLDRNTTLNLSEVANDADSHLDLVQGVVHVISRFKKRFGIVAPFINALVEGTEFSVASGDGKGRVVVAEGKVRASTTAGEQLVTAGQAVEATGGGAPRAITVRPLDAVAWAIHYPQVIWPNDAELVSDAARRSRDLAGSGRYGEALAELDRGGAIDPRLVAWRAGLLLAVGRRDEARSLLGEHPSSDDAAAVAAVIAVAGNDREAARATLATHPGTNSASVALAESYLQQSQRRFDAALTAAAKATELSPGSPIAWSRRAELELSAGHIADGRRSAARALELSPTAARARTLAGFGELLAGETDAARNTFTAALAADSAEPLAHFGLGLADIRRDLAVARREIEIAALLDPSNAELRSYLGRAYMEEGRSGVAGAELQTARQLDPLSPTPWYFDALRKQREGNPLGAISDGEEALARNDNRAVLRPSELIDQDRAARSASLGTAYGEAGYQEVLAAIAQSAVDDDPASAATHRLLADSYSDTPRRESARLSEVLQSQLRQPIGQWPLPAQYATAESAMLGGPRTLSPDEPSSLFDARNYRFAATALAGSQGIGAYGLTVSRAWENIQLALGTFDYRIDGVDNTTPTKLRGTRVDFQARTSPNGMLYAELGESKSDTGDLVQRLVGGSQDSDFRQRIDTTRGRIGYRYDFSATQQILLETSSTREQQDQTGNGFFIPGIISEIGSDIRGESYGAQYLLHESGYSVVAGVNAYRAHFQDRTQVTPSSSPIINPASALHDSYYAYVTRTFDNAAVDAGISHQHFVEDFLPATRRFMGKLGVTVRPWREGTLRFAVFETVKGPQVERQSLEPTTFGGFNQVFDDPDGSRSRRSALRIEQRFGDRTRGGIELSTRKVLIPWHGCVETGCFSEWRERENQIYVSTDIGPRLGLTIALHDERNRRQDPFAPFDVEDSPYLVRTQRLPIRLWFAATPQLTGFLEQTRVRQQAEQAVFDSDFNLAIDQGSTAFWITNLKFKWQQAEATPWSIELSANNLFDRRFRFQNTDLENVPRTPFFFPRRTVFLRFALRY